MDGRGFGEAANDDGSGTALVMELARIFSSPDVETERSIRFILWNNEETGLNGARAYVEARQALQGKEDPAGSRPLSRAEMARHDPARHDAVRSRRAARGRHGQPRAAARSRRQHRVPIELEDGGAIAGARLGDPRRQREIRERLSGGRRQPHDEHGLDAVQDVAPAVSLRENERGVHIGSGWDPHWHQPTDIYANFTDKDFLLGLNAAQTTLGAVAELAGARMKE